MHANQCGRFSKSLRNAALQRIAALSIGKEESLKDGSGFELERLSVECPPHPNQSTGILNGIVKSLLPVSQVAMVGCNVNQ